MIYWIYEFDERGMAMRNSLLHYIKNSPDCFHAVASLETILKDAGDIRLEEGGWSLESGGKYYTTRNGSSLIAFRIPAG